MPVAAIWLVPALLAVLDTIAQRRIHGEPPASASELLFQGGDWLIYAFITPPIFWLSNRWPVERPRLGSRILLYLALSLVFCLAWSVSGTILRLGLNWIFSPDDVARFIQEQGDRLGRVLTLEALSWLFTTLPFGVIVFLCVAGLAHAIRFFVQASEREIQMARLAEQLSTARFTALQAQLNPHFLFNTLNTIAVKARDGDGPAIARIVEQLSDILRRTLSRHRSAEVPLRDEMELVGQYVAIEEARFADTLTASFEIDDDVMDAAVPGFAVQHLVENAIRHGIARRAGAGRVAITARRDGSALVIIVEDDGPGVPTGAAETLGHGLANTRDRLAALYADQARLSVEPVATGGTIATLRLPFKPMAMEADLGER